MQYRMRGGIGPGLSAVVLGGVLLLAAQSVQARPGVLQFYANGEELISEGFLAPSLSKDGWSLTFERVLVNLAGITAFQSDPPYNPHGDEGIVAEAGVSLEGVHLVDLAAGSAANPPVPVGEVGGVAPGHYNAISWELVRATAGPWAGYSLVMEGVAAKEGRRVPFLLTAVEESVYRCGEYVGDRRKGFLAPGGSADLEITFHFDHLFGRADKAADDPLNLQAVGFEPFAAGTGPQLLTLTGVHLGHAGEGHCRVEWR